MFGTIFKKAQATVDNAISQLIYGSLVAVPLAVALGFGTAALSLRLERTYGAETSHLIIAGIFASLAVLGAVVFTNRLGAAQPEAEQTTAEMPDKSAEEQVAPALAMFSAADRELLMAALTTAGPIALPGILRTLYRNLPLLLFVIAAAFVLTRPAVENEADSVEPAE